MLTLLSDPILQAPFIGTMLMCLAASLAGVLLVLRRQSLIGESLSHTVYPGIMLGAIAAGALEFSEEDNPFHFIFLMGGASISAVISLYAIAFLERKCKVPTDSALCFVLSLFFGIGVTLGSQIQFSYPKIYSQVQIYLYGQSATMTDIHIWIYGGLAFAVIAIIALLYKEFKVCAFDRSFAYSLGIPAKGIEAISFFLIILSIIVGIRSVGVVLMSAMLIAPAVSARQFAHKLSHVFGLAAFFGVASGFLGNYITFFFTPQLPTGPMIVLISSFFCITSLSITSAKPLVSRFLQKGKCHA